MAATESPPPTTVVPRQSATASATACVPAANGASSNTPIGPFQNTVARAARCAPRTAPPRSRPDVEAHPAVGDRVGGTTCVSASAANASAATASVGQQELAALLPGAGLRARAAVSCPSSSSCSESPDRAAVGDARTCTPWRRRSGSRRPPRRARSSTPILSDTLAPPTMATNGRSGDSSSRRAPRARAAAAGRPLRAAGARRPRSRRARGARRRTRRSRRRRRAPRARARTPGRSPLARVEAQVLEQQHVAVARASATACLGRAPRRSRRRRRRACRAARRGAAAHRLQRVRRDRARPWAGRGASRGSTRAPRARAASSIVGSAARMRVSSVTTPSSSGTLKSTRRARACPRRSPSVVDVRAPVTRGLRRAGPDRRAGSRSPTRCRTRR